MSASSEPIAAILSSRWTSFLIRLLLVAAYLLGGVSKLLDWPGAVAEQAHFGLHPPTLFAALTIAVELIGPALILLDRLAWLGAAALGIFTLLAAFIANPFWTMQGPERIAAANAFFEHLGLVAGFALIAMLDLGKRDRKPLIGDPTHSPLPWLLLLLSVTTGLVDAISVLGLGKVFTANMTGNIVFLGLAATGAPAFEPIPYLVALSAFLLGALGAGRIGRAHVGLPLRRWLTAAAIIEALLIWASAVMAFGVEATSPRSAITIYAIIAFTAVAMGFRNGTIRQLKIPDLTTTVLTLTLTGLAADSPLAGGANANWPRRLGSVAAIFLGAGIGAFLVVHSGLAAPLFLAGALILLGTILCALHPSSSEPAKG